MIPDALVRYKLVNKGAVNEEFTLFRDPEDEGMNRMTTRQTVCAIERSVKAEPAAALILRAFLLLIRP